MLRSRISKIALGAAVVAALTAGAAGVAYAATVPGTPNLIATHNVVTTHQGEKVPFNSTDVWNIAKGSYDPTLARDHSYVPAKGSYAAAIKKAGGFASGYLSKANGNEITFAVAKGKTGAFAAEQAEIAKTGTPVDIFGPGVKAYEVNGGGTYTGDYEVFVNGYWISVTSNLFTSPQAAAPLIQSILQTIPQG